MYFRLMGKLNARRQNLLEDNEKGFTLIELLVVVIIIGILAAIAIPIYIGVQNNAKDSAVESDLTNVKTAVVSYYTQTQSYPTALDTATLKNYGFSGYSYNYAGNSASAAPAFGGTAPTGTSTTFCIFAKSPTGNTFSVTDSGGVKSGGC
jgi:type IV pilus assembly protein PilA